MTDLISRADAVKTVIRKCSPICAWQVGTQQYPDCVVAEINALPSAEAEWIPVSKALPSEGQVVLAIGDKGTWDVGQFKGTAEWTDDERMWWWKNKSIKRVEYWMPKDAIPLPYREDGEV